MSKSSKMIFYIVNIVFFAFNILVIPFLPNPILFGWLSLHTLLLFGAAPVGSIIWFIYFHAFFAGQKDL